MSSEIPYRVLGRTGEQVSVIGIGGYHLGLIKEEKESIAVVRKAIDSGVNFMDNSWDYVGGTSEIRMGKALRDGYRRKVFLMTKLDGQTRKLAMKQIDESLKRLGTDGVDLLQMHEIIRVSDPERIFAPGGAIEALLEAKQAGKTRYIGFTGHKSPAIHLKMLETARDNGFAFDTVQMPLNVLDAHFDSFEKRVLPVLVKDDTGVLAMKPLANGAIPAGRLATAAECLRYAMSLPVSVVITGCDSLAILEQALEAARNFKPLDGEERAALLARTQTAAATGRYEHYKTEKRYDSTDLNPHWLS